MLVKIEDSKSNMWANRASNFALSLSRALCYLKDTDQLVVTANTPEIFSDLEVLQLLIVKKAPYGDGFEAFASDLQNHLNSLPNYLHDGIASVNAQEQHAYIVAMLDYEAMYRFIMGTDAATQSAA